MPACRSCLPAPASPRWRWWSLRPKSPRRRNERTEFKLANGLDVVVIPDHRAPVVTQMVWYKVGAADEPPGSSGIAHFLEHLMFKGTDTIPTGQFSKIVARNGGEDNAFTNHDVTAYFQRVAKDRLPTVMAMEADRMANLRLSEEDVVTERNVILEERRSRVDNDPGSILQEQMMAALYANHPYGIPIIGWEHEIEALDRTDALTYYKRFYAPNNAILIVAGDVEPDEVKLLAENTYGKLKAELRAERTRAPEGARALRAGQGDARGPARRAHYGAEILSIAELCLGRARRGRGTRPSDARRRLRFGQPHLQEARRRGEEGRQCRRLVFRTRGSIRAGSASTPSPPRASRPRISMRRSRSVIEELRETGTTEDELDRARASYLAEFVYTSDSQSRMARQYGWRLSPPA